MTLTFSVLLAVALDYCFGEPANAYHPLVAFGRWVNLIEAAFYPPAKTPSQQKFRGFLAWTCALIPSLLGLAWPLLPSALQTVYAVLVLYFCIGARSLQQHAAAVYQALTRQDLDSARCRVGYMVSRQTGHMTADDVRRATVESVLENGADAVFAPIFWFVLLGPFGALLYRLSNTLDAMWGYKNERYQYFGYTAARFDDLLNWLPARLTALSYTLLGDTRRAWHAWRYQARLLDSPNAGPVMTAGAGAMRLKLGGPARYHGQLKQKPWFGGEQVPNNGDITRASALVYRSLAFWLLMIAIGDTLA